MDEKKCETCLKAIFDPLWGDFKCSVTKVRATDEQLKNGCDEYKKGKPEISKGIDENV